MEFFLINLITQYFWEILLLIALLSIFHWYILGAVCKIKKNLLGQVIIVTGCNSGIGYETVKKLYELNATIVLACRD
jgi:hypothetical protein